MASVSIGDSTITTVPAVARSVQPLRREVAGLPRSHPGEPAEQHPQVPLAGAVPGVHVARPRSPAATPGRPIRTWCSAMAAAARTVTSRLLAIPSTPADRPWSASASTTSSTPASCSARVVTTWSAPDLSETRQLIRRSRSPAWNGRIAANSVPSPWPPRPVPPHQADRLRHLGARVEGRGRRQHRHRLPGQRHRPPAVPAPRRRQPDPLLPQDPHPPAPRADLDHRAARRPASRSAPTLPVRRLHRDVRRSRGHAGDVLHAVRVVDHQPRARALSLVSASRGRARCAAAASRRAGAAARARPPAAAAPRARPAPGRRTAPRGRPRSRPRPGPAPAPRVGCQPFMSLVGLVQGGRASAPRRAPRRPRERPLASVIQSSGLTVIRCARTERATTLTSSGMT